MFKLINSITDDVFEYCPTKNGVVYISHLIGEKDYKITHHIGEKIYVDVPDISIGQLCVTEDFIYVARSGGLGFVYDQNLANRKQISFHFWKKYDPYSLFMQPSKDILDMGFADNLTLEIQWKLDYYSMQQYLGENLFYAVKNVNEKNNHLYAYDRQSGKEKWLYVIEQEELYGIVYFYTEYQGKLFINAKKHLVLDCETGKLISSSEAYGGRLHYENKVPHLLSWYSRLNLETFEETLFDIKPLLVPYWGDYQHTTYMDCLVEGNILIGTHESLVTTNSPEEAAFHLLLIDPDKNEVVWSHEFPYKGLSNYKEARYENGKLYFLDKDGCLTIFEKEI